MNARGKKSKLDEALDRTEQEKCEAEAKACMQSYSTDAYEANANGREGARQARSDRSVG